MPMAGETALPHPEVDDVTTAELTQMSLAQPGRVMPMAGETALPHPAIDLTTAELTKCPSSRAELKLRAGWKPNAEK